MDGPIDSHLRDALAGLPGLRLVLLFGSAGRGAATAESDIDLAVLAEAPLSSAERSEIIARVAERTGRPVDLVDLAQAGEPLLGEILRNGCTILARDSRARAELLRRHLFDATDFLPLRRRILAARRRAWIGS